MIDLERHDEVLPPQLYRALGQRTGVIGTLFLEPPYRGSPKAYQTITSHCDIEYLVDHGDTIDLSVSGKGVALADSMTSCVGEFLERYSLCWLTEDDIRRETYRSLVETDCVVDFDYLDIYSDAFRDRFLAEFTRETEIPWAAGTNLCTGETVYVPAEYVWMHVGPLEPGPSHVIGSSNGVAAGPSLEEALLWAMYERIERDGIMRTWWQRTVPDRIDIDSIPQLRDYVDEHLPHEEFSMHLLECESAIDIPTYASAFVSSTGEYPKFAIAGSASLDQESALFDAATEALQGWPYLHHIALQYDLEEFNVEEVVEDYTRNVLYYAQPDNFDDLQFLLDGPVKTLETDRYPGLCDWSVERRITILLERFEDAGCTPIGFDVTSPDVRQCGTHVARVFVPELIGLTPPAAAPVDHPTIDSATVNDRPHPFP